nr:immunoglobulin light chain junction region [Macaca mulatta]MOX69414.1 immunoglobulin light chain junction region [Macaca mulatta]MOX69551.1 immunoglobulin light chain junction region [Macaca mulatta]MOX69588.1 immunoglobulin light chain junction region [Macaca mulatta]MOX69828.1 immunoglobulin light chain junction region [Macaca mulatta]
DYYCQVWDTGSDHSDHWVF